MIWLSLLGCFAPPDLCDGSTQWEWDPASGDLDAWPDDFWTVEDDQSPTGSRLQIADSAWYTDLPELLQSGVTHLDGMTGFGTQAELVLRFSGTLGDLPSVDASTTDPGIRLYDLSGDEPRRVPYEARVAEGGEQLQLLPVGPLATGAEHALVVTNDLLDGDGRCIAPGDALTGILDRTSDTYEDRIKPTKRLLKDLELPADDISALVTFTTHTDHEPFLAAAEHAREVAVDFDGWTCVDDDGIERCDTFMEVQDYRGPDLFVVDAPQGTYRLPVSFWLPDDAVDMPVIVYGHGLSQSRLDGRELAEMIVPAGVVLVGVDALHHGDHPSAEGSPDPAAFLGIDRSSGIAFDLPSMRASFDQSNLDRRQLINALMDHRDLDGDGVNEIDPERMSYIGMSLGGILGSGLMMMSEELEAGVLAIAGANLSSIVRDNDMVNTFRPLLVNLAGTEEELEMVFSLLQTAIDPSDPAIWAARVLEDRPFGGDAPHVLLPVAIEDEIVPPAAGRALARAYGLPHVQPIAEPVGGLPDAGAAPVASNLDGKTVGFFQYDRMTMDGELIPTHHLMPRSEEFAVQIDGWLTGWLTDGTPVIVDPFEIMGTPEL